MPGYKSKPIYPGSDDNDGKDWRDSSIRYDIVQGGWRDFDGFAIGRGYAPQVLAANGYADSSVAIGLQTAVPHDYASISISIGNVVNLDAFANVAGSGSVTSSATSQALLTLTNGQLTGTYSAVMSIDVTAYLAADHAMVDMRITDTFSLSLVGTGYVGASLTSTSASGGTIAAITPNGGGGAGGGKGETFDLARFAASVLNTGQWNIAFVASAPGESLHVLGSSVLTISATADLLEGQHPEVLRFGDTERAHMAFNDTSSPLAAMPYGMPHDGSGPVSMFHNA